MPRVVVLGGTGMLGHVVWATCRERGVDAIATVRDEELRGEAAAALDAAATVTSVRADEPASVERALDRVAPDAVVNCVGVVKQAAEAGDPVRAITVNALFPHRLATACRHRDIRLIHVSTDCVFSGDRGQYGEGDDPDPRDLYGRTKLLGEVAGDGALTLRTSIVGRELRGANGLLEWFLGRTERSVRGFTKAFFSGPTAPELARVICALIEEHPQLDGIWHVGAARISKFDLLRLFADAFELATEVEPDESVVVDRSLDAGRFRAATGWEAPDWQDMVAELAAGAERYGDLRGQHAGR